MFAWLQRILDPHRAARERAEQRIGALSSDEVVEVVHRAAQLSDPAVMQWVRVAAPRAPPGLPPVARAILEAYRIETANTGLVIGGEHVVRRGDRGWCVGSEETFHTSIWVRDDERVFEHEEGFEPDLAAPTLGHFLLLRGEECGAFDLATVLIGE